jgi:hypothetical protein
VSVNLMNVGADYVFAFYNPNTGTLLELGDVQNVTVTAQKHDIKSMPYNNVPRYGYVPDGFRISFTITRSTSTLEDFMVAYDAAFNAGQVIPAGYLNETINNADGTVSKYQYVNMVVFLTDHGDVSREKVVTQKFEGMASEKISLQ